MKKKPSFAIPWAFTLTALSSILAFSVPASANSGPVTTPREYESEAIQNAPAYDTEDAKTYIDGMPQIRALTDGLADEEGLITFGAVSPSDSAFEELKQEIEKLTADDHIVSLIMADLRTKSGVAFQSSLPMCSQSTIKGIYIGALLESKPEAMEENGQFMHDAIVYSKNAPYTHLWDTYGPAPMEKWCKEADVDLSFAKTSYPRDKTARDMFKMWTRLYCYLNGEAQDSEFASWFADSSCSATRKQLGDRFPVQTKAGWEHGLDENHNFDPHAPIPEIYTDGDPVNDECSINDTGIVYTDKGPYIFVIYTDYPFGVFMDYADPNPLYDLVEALYHVQASIAENGAVVPEPGATVTDTPETTAESSGQAQSGTDAAGQTETEAVAGPNLKVEEEVAAEEAAAAAKEEKTAVSEVNSPPAESGTDPTATPVMVPAPDREDAENGGPETPASPARITPPRPLPWEDPAA